MIRENYIYQAKLLVNILPFVFEEDRFSLKGGTAINLFYRDMPRLSVDIDLTYLPIEDRIQTLHGINQSFEKIANKIQTKLTNTRIGIIRDRANHARQIIISEKNVRIKVETNNVFRGTVFPCKKMDLCEKAQRELGLLVNVKVSSFEDIYAGKICAALDRQHPRDLFDVKILLENEGITDQLRKTFLIYLAANNRPIVELLNPNYLDMKQAYEEELVGMGEAIDSYQDLMSVRDRLISIIRNQITDAEKMFLLSFKKANPDWSLLGLEGIERLPAIMWKLQNIRQMDKKKHENLLSKLISVLEG